MFGLYLYLIVIFLSGVVTGWVGCLVLHNHRNTKRMHALTEQMQNYGWRATPTETGVTFSAQVVDGLVPPVPEEVEDQMDSIHQFIGRLHNPELWERDDSTED